MAEAAFTLHAVSIVNHVDSGLLDIGWSDGTQQQSAHAFLRKHCKCADCISADRPEFSAALRLREIRPVGSYGLQLIFNDFHDRGIYPWSYLHGLGTRTGD